jgi:hypothetical protein
MGKGKGKGREGNGKGKEENALRYDKPWLSEISSTLLSVISSAPFLVVMADGSYHSRSPVCQ